MTRIPHARGVGKALRGVKGAIVRSVKGLNQAASQRMAKGDYATAETLVAKGKEIRLFQAEVEALGKRWREVTRGSKSSSGGTESPLWAYYQPILQALVESGGECRRNELEPLVERLMSAALQPGDRQAMARGRERWRVMIQRARKALVSEGWIEARSGKDWRITDAGRRAASKPLEGALVRAVN
jgi:hypothetical protein